MGRVEGKVALITGAASGIGAESARILAREGAHVVVTDVQDDLGRKLVEKEIPGALYLHQDVRSEERWGEVVAETVARFGKLDILVNNAGVMRVGAIEDASYEDYRFQVEIMLDGTFLGCKTAIIQMIKGGGGAVINMVSAAGLKGLGMIPAYSATKGGIIAMTRSIAVHCVDKQYGIRVNAIAPGGIETPLLAQFAADTGDDGKMPGLGAPEDVANLVLFLASEESRFVTGAIMTVDNGETAR